MYWFRSTEVPDIPYFFTWNSGDFEWKSREAFSIRGSNPKKCDFRRRTDPVIGRMNTVSPRERERYFLRTLSLHQKGASSYEELRRINGIQHDSFRDACAALGSLADETEWRNALREYYASRFHTLTELFSLILVYCEPFNLLQIGSDQAYMFISDIRHRYRGASSALIRLGSDSDPENYALCEVKMHWSLWEMQHCLISVLPCPRIFLCFCEKSSC